MSRPKKQKEYHKNYRVTIRFPEDEYASLCTNSGSAGMNISEYIREQISRGKVNAVYKVVSDTESTKKLAQEYHKIGINLNQIAMHLNSGGSETDDLVKEIRKCVTELQELNRRL